MAIITSITFPTISSLIRRHFICSMLLSGCICLMAPRVIAQGSVGIGTPIPAASAMLDVTSTTKGVLIPRMTQAQRIAVANPAAGLLVYETTSQGFFYYNGSQWTSLSGGGGGASPWVVSGNNIYTSNSGNVGINTQTPSEKLHIQAGNLAIITPQFNGPYINLETTYLPVLNSPNNTGITFRRNGTWVGSMFYHAFNTIPGNPNPTMLPGVLRLSASAAGANDLVIASNGNVGINRYSPLHPLHVAGAIYTDNSLIINETSAILQMQSEGTNKGFMQLSGDNVRLGTNSGNAGNLLFRLNGSDRVTITSAGNMGIGTPTPLAKLDVAGRIRVLQNGEAIALDGNAPNIGFWFNGNYRSFIAQSATNQLYIGVNSGNLRLDATGHVAIGNVVATTNAYKLTVSGKILCEELKVSLQNNWPDYVFADNYKLESYEGLRDFIKTNRHLPNIPSADAMQKSGLELGEMQRKMMEKIEELTLYILDLESRLKKVENK